MHRCQIISTFYDSIDWGQSTIAFYDIVAMILFHLGYSIRFISDVKGR